MGSLVVSSQQYGSKIVVVLLLIFNLVSTKAEDYDYNENDQCSEFFPGKHPEPELQYNCVEKTRCKDGREADGITVFNSGNPDLTAFINAAQTAECPGNGEICCAVRFTENPEESGSNGLYAFWTFFCCGCLL